MTTAEEYKSSGILELYVSGVLSEEESREVESMAKKYPEIKAEIEAIEAVMLKLSESETQTPGDKLFDKILEQINEEDAESPVIGDYEEDNIIPLHPFHDRQRRRYISLMAASVALFLLSSVSNVYFFNKWKSTEKDYTAMQKSMTSVAEQYKKASYQINSMSDELASYKGKDVKVVMLNPVKKGMEYKAVALWNPKMKSVELKIMNLPPAPAGKQYQLWAIADGKPVDAGMVSDMGSMEAMKSIGSAQAFAITLENAGGSPTPTMTAMVVMGAVEI